MKYISKILSIKDLTHDVKSFLVEKPKGYKFSPGQATEVAINKEGWEDEKRPFTFTSLNEDKTLEFVIKRYSSSKFPEHKGMTEKLHALKKGDEITFDDPWGTIVYNDPGIFIAGGAGITPFIAIFRDLGKSKRLKGNKLFFSNKEEKDVILKDELSSTFKEEDLIFTLTREERKGFEYGRINGDFLKKHIKDFSVKFYLCGSREMVSDLQENLKTLGLTSESLVFEK